MTHDLTQTGRQSGERCERSRSQAYKVTRKWGGVHRSIIGLSSDNRVVHGRTDGCLTGEHTDIQTARYNYLSIYGNECPLVRSLPSSKAAQRLCLIEIAVSSSVQWAIDTQDTVCTLVGLRRRESCEFHHTRGCRSPELRPAVWLPAPRCWSSACNGTSFTFVPMYCTVHCTVLYLVLYRPDTKFTQ